MRGCVCVCVMDTKIGTPARLSDNAPLLPENCCIHKCFGVHMFISFVCIATTHTHPRTHTHTHTYTHTHTRTHTHTHTYTHTHRHTHTHTRTQCERELSYSAVKTLEIMPIIASAWGLLFQSAELDVHRF